MLLLQYYSNEDNVIVSLLKQLGMSQHKYQFTRGIATTNRYVGAQTHQKRFTNWITNHAMFMIIIGLTLILIF